jgi:quercetin dioxygenase-like cupin family protein
MALHHLHSSEKIRLASLQSTADRKKSALVKTDAFETVQLLLRAGEDISPHAVPGYATVHCLEGSIILQTEERIELSAGDWIYLDRGQRHSVSAVEHSSLLVTILFG